MKRRLLHLALVMVVARVAAAGCGSDAVDVGGNDASSTDATNVDSSVTQTVGPAGGTVEVQGVSLSIPSGALASEQAVHVATVNVSSAGDEPYTPVYEFTPSGLVFAKPATVSFTLTGSKELPTVFWTNESGDYEPLSTDTAAAGRVSAQIAHFSRGFVGRRRRVLADSGQDADSTPDATRVPCDASCPGQQRACYDGRCQGPTKVGFVSAPQTVAVNTCSGIVTVETRDPDNQPAPLKSALSIYLAAVETGVKFYSDEGCTTQIVSVPLPAGGLRASYYFKSTETGAREITAESGNYGLAYGRQTETIQ